MKVPKRIGVPHGFRSAGDEILVAAAKDGEAQAFEALVERHQRKIFFTALRMTRNKEDAEDVVQQSLQKAFTHLNSFAGTSSFSTWLTRVAMNEALMLLRKKRGSREVLLDDLGGSEEDTPAFELPDLAPDPEVTCAQQELAGLILSAINRLAPGMRTAFHLRELDERSIEETARIMGISATAVKGRLFHGRRKLREILGQYLRSLGTT